MRRLLILLPPFAWLLLLVAAPLAILGVIALAEAGPGVPPFLPPLGWEGGPAWRGGLESFRTLVADDYYAAAFLRSAGVAGVTAGLCLLLAYPMALGIAAARAFATGERAGYVAGAVVAYLAFLFDCVDGQLARLTQTFSEHGAYLDGMFDRGKEYVIYAGLALGGGEWSLACVAIALQTTRHAIDYGSPRATAAPTPAAAPAAPPTVSAWLKRIAHFPIGERFAVIVLVTAFAAPEATLWVLIGGGALALAYVAAGRLRKGDDRWVTTAAQRAIEFGGIAAAGIATGVPQAAYAILFGLAALHYHRLLA